MTQLSPTRRSWRARHAWIAAAAWLCISPAPAAQHWNTAYYAAYQTQWLPPDQIDYGALTTLIHLGVLPRADGTLDAHAFGLSAARSAEVVRRAHAAGTRVLLCVGGDRSAAGFRGATDGAHRAALVANLVDLVRTRGYDGIDLDWEPLSTARDDGERLINLVADLRGALDLAVPGALLTAAAYNQPATYARVQGQLDQINLMLYTMVSPRMGASWFATPLRTGNYSGGQVHSVDGVVRHFVTAGVARDKLGLGMSFYPVVWRMGVGTPTGGVTAPRQNWLLPPSLSLERYDDVMLRARAPEYQALFDDSAQVPYLSRRDPLWARSEFVSYEDDTSIRRKAEYVRRHRLGGLMTWELAGGYRPGQLPGQRDGLLQSTRHWMLEDRTPPPAPDLWIYDERVTRRWRDASQGAAIDFGARGAPHVGEHAVRVDQAPGGGLSLRYAGGRRQLDTSPWTDLEFYVRAEPLSLLGALAGREAPQLQVQFANHAAKAFPAFSVGPVYGSGWQKVSIPMRSLNPDGSVVGRLWIRHVGTRPATFWIDDLRAVAP